MAQKDSSPPPQNTLPTRLLAWYDRHKRDLPWRAGLGGPRTAPYRVWLSEVIMQQTTVAAGRPYYDRFVERWPTVQELAHADLDDVLHAWQGLGYYARARNLHKCANQISHQLDGRFPDTESALLALPGIGAYTAAAIAAIAFERRATPVDGNVERVMARLYGVETPLPKAKPDIKKLAQALTPATRCGDYAQAVMELGATVCRPRAPKCEACPWVADCQALAMGRVADFPVKAAKAEKPVRYGVVFWLVDDGGAVLVRRRPDAGLLGGMIEFPSTPWAETRWADQAWADHAPVLARWTPITGRVRHTFSHFHLELEVVRGQLARQGNRPTPPHTRWCQPADFGTLALPSVMKKVARLLGP